MKIYIGPRGVGYDVRFRTLDENDLGIINYKHLQIDVDNTMPPAMQLRALMHEVAHGILWGLAIKNNEGNTSSLGDALLQLIRDNPDLIEHIRRGGSDAGT